jgi:hypothetical protein
LADLTCVSSGEPPIFETVTKSAPVESVLAESSLLGFGVLDEESNEVGILLGLGGVAKAPTLGLGAFDVAEDEDESPNGYDSLLVVSGGRGGSASSGCSGLVDCGFWPKRLNPVDFEASGFEPNRLPELRPGVGWPKRELPGVGEAVLPNFKAPGVSFGVVDSGLV